MDAAQALQELVELSSQVERAVVLQEDGSVLAATTDDDGAAQSLARAARDLVSAAADLHGSEREVARVDVELAEGAVFVLRESGRTIAAATGPGPTAGLVVYDLRTCLQRIDDAASPKPGPKRRAVRKPKESE